MESSNRYNRQVDEPRMGPARLFAIVFGVAYLGIALTEAVLGWTGNTLALGGVTVLSFALMHNIIHWATGIVLLGVLGFGRWPTKITARTIGFVYAAVFLLGILTPAFMGTLMGHGDSVPMVYNMIYLATGGFGLLAGFTSHAEPYMVRGRTHRRMA